MIDLSNKFKITKCLNSTIECLISHELSENEFKEKVQQAIKNILPNADMYLISVITNYAKSMRNCNEYKKILYNEIDKYINEVPNE